MKLVVGLGNIGSRYVHTRHNLGFMMADQLATDLGATWKLEEKLRAAVATLEIEGDKVVIAKPTTMMNLSGEAVQRLMQHYKVAPADVWVVFDDVDVPFGRLRLRHGGSYAGHQGVASIAGHIGDNFLRVRAGISLNDRSVESSEQYVLRSFNANEQEALPQIIESASQILRQQLTLEAPEETTFSLL